MGKEAMKNITAVGDEPRIFRVGEQLSSPLRHEDGLWRVRKDVPLTTRHKSDQLPRKILHDDVDLKKTTSRRTLGCGTRRTASRTDIRSESVLFAERRQA